MTACRACCEALKANAAEEQIDAKQLLRLNQMLDAIEGSKSSSCSKAHVCTVRALLKEKKSVDVVKRSQHCNHCRWTLKNHIPSLVEKEDANAGKECDLLTFDSLKTLVDWSCSDRGEELRTNDPKTFDDVLASFAWRAREQMQLGSYRGDRNDEWKTMREAASMF